MQKKSKKLPTVGLSQWVLRGPLLFGVICSVLFTIMALMGMASQFIGLMTPVVLVIAGIPAVRLARAKPLDYRSYIAADNALTILALVFTVASVLITPFIPVIVLHAFDLGRAMHALALFGLFVLSYYLIGLVLMNLYVVYLRAVKMGVPKWKIIFSMPFTSLFAPAYFLRDKTTSAPVVCVRPNWFARLTDWVAMRPRNAAIFYTLMTVLGLIVQPDRYSTIVTLVPIGLFILYLGICNPARRRENIGGIYATLAVIINILLILYSLWNFISY